MSKVKSFLSRNQLLHTLFNLEGNARACIYTEPLFGVPVNLYMPLSAKYMQALGLDELQIGVVLTIYVLSQMFFSTISGLITDKLGRRWTTTIFDCISWALPFLIWMNAQGFAWFVVAAAFNGSMRVTDNAWSLLMVEDAPPSKLVSIYSLSTIGGLLSGFAAPLTSLFVTESRLVPTMRWLYLFAFACMVTKIIILHTHSKETNRGRERKEELRGKPLTYATQGSFSVVRQMFFNKPLMLVLLIMSCVMVIRSSTQNFWPLLVTGKLGVSESTLPLLSAMKSIAQLIFFFWIAPRLKPQYFYKPMILALGIMTGLHVMWFILPGEAASLVYAGVLAEALEMSILIPMFSSLQMLLLDQKERARMYGFSISFCLLITSPFGTINGFLGRSNASLPMLMSAVLAGVAIFLLTQFKATADQKGLLTARNEAESA